jgi:hypothetical protein
MIWRKKKEITYPMTSLINWRKEEPLSKTHHSYHGTMDQTLMILLECTDGNAHHQWGSKRDSRTVAKIMAAGGAVKEKRTRTGLVRHGSAAPQT